MNLREASHQLKNAACPEDVFGDDPKNVHKVYRQWTKVTHPDLAAADDRSLADQLFKEVKRWYDQAKKKLSKGTYGDRHDHLGVVISTKTESYTLSYSLATGDISDLYLGHSKSGSGNEVVVKIARSSLNNDLLRNESKILSYIHTEGPTCKLDVTRFHLPKLLDSFEMRLPTGKKQVNVLGPKSGYLTLEEIAEAYPNGIELGDAAWMWNRLLGALLAAHQADVVHGAVIPSHLLVHPKKHNGVLVDWCYAVKKGERIKAISPRWKEFYPSEIFVKNSVGPETDVYMAARCFVYLIGGEAKLSQLPPRVSGLIRACLLSQRRRMSNVWELFEDFSGQLKVIFGSRKFREFAMPVKS